MATTVLSEPRPKRRVSIPRNGPFPIPLSQSEESEVSKEETKPQFTKTALSWKFYRGELGSSGVKISDESSINDLNFKGFFGKGSLSKNIPNFQRNQEIVDGLPVLSKARYKRHLDQAKEHLRLSVVTKESSKEGVKVIQLTEEDEEEDDVEMNQSENTYVLVREPNEPGSSEADPNLQKAEDPLPVKECLQLTFEEAFFLSYGLGCLLVADEKGKILDILTMWRRFCELSHKNFPAFYTAYHYFRSKGWIVKTGLKYGADFLLYKDGPPFYHASYSVLVVVVKEGILREDSDKGKDRHSTWASLAALNRVTLQVAKEILYCHVIQPNGIKDEDLQSPNCISQFQVQEILMKRWVSSKERESEEQGEL
ncbi:tRNA-splicing endonuclease subunit Sen2-like [Limulus polyphemus]|uniref:tRNA-splicing endonuclease subunit Sen2 n=1 Tax=Limulus polyphemus TaxID=6850 RepID=A0ABM1BSC1_LIMPO|nr:tRNA-splicing endonuclease subunit Sen2-like [Limulus polyphemus]XP_022255972.1 tRNA-splicing endonuclease subunit Sen2-like [Limulus polyphemus]XP_022255973.1 tRNA-splicing endonuclease subunit Sen2-like [Limulus polyphemus]